MLFVGTLYVLYRGRREKNSMRYVMLGSAVTMWIVSTVVRDFPIVNNLNLTHNYFLAGTAPWPRLFTHHDGLCHTQGGQRWRARCIFSSSFIYCEQYARYHPLSFPNFGWGLFLGLPDGHCLGRQLAHHSHSFSPAFGKCRYVVIFVCFPLRRLTQFAVTAAGAMYSFVKILSNTHVAKQLLNWMLSFLALTLVTNFVCTGSSWVSRIESAVI
jgi:hypothetical protein